ncbi:hypothetical protein L2K70_11085 [Nocardioides KLBMP 9356]|uniref:IclR-ED domain-containing protein n=1 Tax=Nocardioides potassii TaxID=2911371 RepID=A0ABS9HCW4_9ACTN|nr:IclR family transcriptional regulator C-terminal domain-containing protein [Nocardioides potassii]MCF6378147.1 hypothetical protein [Nocardioides potassii]
MVREDGSFPLRSHVLHEGRRFPLGVASAGTAILAYMSPQEIDACLARSDRVQYGAAHEATQVRARLATTRDVGWALNPGLIVEGSWGMGAAVFDEQGSPIGALSLTGVEHRFTAARQPDLGRRLLSAAHELSGRLRATR